ncbi:MAG: hypothetical protein WBV75_11100, partial [Robiginitalea sp.]
MSVHKSLIPGLISLLCIFLCIQGCKDGQDSPLDTTPVAFSKEGELQIFNTDTDSIRVALDIE